MDNTKKKQRIRVELQLEHKQKNQEQYMQGEPEQILKKHIEEAEAKEYDKKNIDEEVTVTTTAAKNETIDDKDKTNRTTENSEDQNQQIYKRTQGKTKY